MYPIFITDDADAEVEIKSLPGQKRYAVMTGQHQDKILFQATDCALALKAGGSTN